MEIQSIKKLGLYPGAKAELAGILPSTVYVGANPGPIIPTESVFFVDQETFLVNVTGKFTGGILSKGKEVASLATQAPTGISSSGNKNDFYIDSNFLYVCVEENRWKRTNLTDWYIP